mgnify:CR=1 FL=1
MRTNELALQQTLNKFLVTTIYGAKEKIGMNHHVSLFISPILLLSIMLRICRTINI